MKTYSFIGNATYSVMVKAEGKTKKEAEKLAWDMVADGLAVNDGELIEVEIIMGISEEE